MKKAILLGLLVLGSLFYKAPEASAKTLYDCFKSQGLEWTSVSKRAITAVEQGVWKYRGTAQQNTLLSSRLCPKEALLGFSVATGYQSTLSASISTAQDYIPVSSLRLKDLSTLSITTLGGRVFLNLEAGGNKEEIIMCTGINSSTVRFTGCTRGLAFSGTSTAAVSTNQKTHNAGSIIVMSNVHYVYEQFVDVNDKPQTIQGDRTASGTWTFSGVLPRARTSTPTRPDELITLDYLTSVTTTGCGNASSSTRGCVQESTTSSNFLGTQVGSTGARNFVSVLTITTSSDYATKSGFLPALRADSQLDASFGGNPGSLATLDADQKVAQNPASATSTPTPNKIVISSSTGGLDAWVLSLPNTVNAIASENTHYTYPLTVQPNIAPAAAVAYTNGFHNFYSLGGTADLVQKYGGFTSTTLVGNAQTYVTMLVPTSSIYLKFGASQTTSIKWRMRMDNHTDGLELIIGFVSSTRDEGSTILYTASSTAAADAPGGGRIVFDITGTSATTNGHLASVTSNGTALTRNHITGITTANWNTYEIKYNVAAVEFWVNGVLRATHTSNFPVSSAAGSGVGFGFGHTTGKVGFQMTDPIISQQL